MPKKGKPPNLIFKELVNFFAPIVIGGLIYLIYRCIKDCLLFLLNLFRKFEINTSSHSFRILEIENELQCKSACQELKSHCQDLNVLGFDCEWICINGKQRPVALLQLASPNGLCCLFRLTKLQYIPFELEEILRNCEIIKVGVTPLNDAKLLLRDFNTQVCSTLDLRHLYPAYTSLGSLSKTIIGVELDKSWHLRCSNWEDFTLTDAQKEYAAKDVFVAVEIFKKWLSDNSSTNVTAHSSNNTLLNEKLSSQIFRFLDIHYNPKLSDLLSTSNKKEIVPESISINDIRKQSKGFVVRKSPLYDNWFMYAPDGQLLCSCDRRKAQWYIDRCLAELVPGEPYAIQLLFEPAARADESVNGKFYRQLKQNCCVVCGASESYLKHNVVPREYRKHFPAIMKDHQSHDIVLMCVRCHYIASAKNERLKLQLEILCDAPFSNGRTKEDQVIKKIKNCAKALTSTDNVIPQKRKLELENQIKQFFEVNNVTPELLKKAITLESKILNEDTNSHGLKVVKYFKTSMGGLENLEFLWREHFLETMKPEYLPTFWSSTHNHSKLNNAL